MSPEGFTQLVQKDGAALGFDFGPPDGVPGRLTTAAWDELVAFTAKAKRIERPSGIRVDDKTPWMDIATREIGVSELRGDRHNPRILEYHQATSLKATQDEVSWCAAFVNWCLNKCGYAGTGSAAARSFLKWGREIGDPVPGCIVIFWRGDRNGWQGHVGFYVERTDNFIRTLGGNQSDKVCIARYSDYQLLGYRMPA